MQRSVFLYTLVCLCLLPALVHAGERKVIVGFRKALGVTDFEKHDRVRRAGGRLGRSHAVINAVAVRIPEEAIAALKQDPWVAYVEEDRVFSVTEPPVQQSAPSAEYLQSWGVMRIGADLAARNGIRGAGVKVAIIDTGIDYNHPDLKDNYRGGYNFLLENSDPYDDSRTGHGTHIAGIIAAKDNGTGVVGVAPDASIYALKALNMFMFGNTSNVLAALEWAISNKMDVINVSFGMPNDPLFFSQAVKDACDLAHQSGIIIVAAAGNSAQPVLDYPADFDSVIAVSAIAANDSFAPFSNYGAKVELAAPGVDITSTVPGGGYGLLTGTSQATPHVAGAAALLLSTGVVDSVPARKRVEKVRSMLGDAASDLGESGRDQYFGYGLVRAASSYTVQRRRGLRRDDALTLTVQPGQHTIEVINHGLRRLVIKTPQGEEDVAHARHRNWSKENQYFTFDYQTDTTDRITFYPHGEKGSSAEISISNN